MVAMRPSLSTAHYCSLRSPRSWWCGLPRPQGAPARPPWGIRQSPKCNGRPSSHPAKGQGKGQGKDALKLCKQHRAGALSRLLVSGLWHHGSLLKFNVIVCVVASAGLVRAAHACLCTSHDRPLCSAAPFLPLSFPPAIKLPSGARTGPVVFRSAPWARRNSIAATWPFSAA